MLYQDFPVFADVYALTVKVFMVTQDFPREYKCTLGQDMKRDCLVLLRSIYRINKSGDKAAYLEGFLDNFELLRLQVRLATDGGVTGQDLQGGRVVLKQGEVGGQCRTR